MRATVLLTASSWLLWQLLMVAPPAFAGAVAGSPGVAPLQTFGGGQAPGTPPGAPGTPVWPGARGHAKGEARGGGAAAGPRFLALGDSYTVGEGVLASQAWPEQLTALLRQRGLALKNPEILARTGWTLGQLTAAVDEAAPEGPYALVSLLIGVNDQYRGGRPESYRPAFAALLARAIGFAGGHAGHVLVLSIPDWSVTPFAAASGRDVVRIAREIRAYNAINREETSRAGAVYVDVTPDSQQVRGDRGLLAPDGLHPGAAMYARWAQLALPAAAAALGEKP